MVQRGVYRLSSVPENQKGILQKTARVPNFALSRDVYFRTNKQTGVTYSGKLCNPSDAEPSAAQIAAKARFTKVVAAVRTVLADPTEKAKLKKEFKAQTKIGSLFGYAMHKLNGNYDSNGDLIGD